MGFRVIIIFFTLLHKIVSYNPEITTKQCYGSALLNRNCKNPFEIAFGDGIFALLNHFLTVCAACAQTWDELLRNRSICFMRQICNLKQIDFVVIYVWFKFWRYVKPLL